MFIKERLNLKKSNLPPHPPQNNKKQVISIKVKMKRERQKYIFILLKVSDYQAPKVTAYTLLLSQSKKLSQLSIIYTSQNTIGL